VHEVEVEMVRLDDWVKERGLRIDFIKIDVEGYEWNVLQGMPHVLSTMHPRLMVEVQANRPQIFEYLSSEGYLLFSPELDVLDRPELLHFNVFALHREAHAAQIEALGLDRRSADPALRSSPRATPVCAKQAPRPGTS